MKVNVEDRVKKAIDLFNEGYNCSQAVVVAYSDLYGLDSKLAKSISHSFGGGLGRMREVCGAISGLSMLLGLEHPVDEANDMDARTRNYAEVQRASSLFKEKHQTIICRELLKTLKPSNNPTPSERNDYYYSIRPCGRFVEDAARIFGNMINETR
ncbi:MAG: C-GCAxxG-C-C family protein [Bacteroidales bacterium]